MQELLKVIVAGLVEDPTAIQITEDAPNEEGVIDDKRSRLLHWVHLL